MRHLALSLAPTPPFRLDLTVWALRRRPDNAMDRWDGETYRRTWNVGGRPVESAVRQAGPPESPRLDVSLTGAALDGTVGEAIAERIEWMLGLGIDLAPFYRMAESDPVLARLASRFVGVKPPRLPSLFETLANAVACQQITLTQGIRLLNRLAETYGLPGGSADEPTHAFPTPAALASADPDAIRALGYSGQKARSLVAIGREIAEGRLRAEDLAILNDDEAVARLREHRGVGRWTAEYVLLRGLGRYHVFPGDDVGARKNLERWLAIAEPLDYAGVSRTIGLWRDFGGLVYFHLLLDRLTALGLVE